MTIYYKLIDEYIYFYLKWIEPIKNTLQKKSLDRGNWQGYAFEAVCYKHISLIRKVLSISEDAIANSWRYVPHKGIKSRGAQIDLLFDRKDDVIKLCEIKYSDEPYILTKNYIDILKRKIKVFKDQTKTKKELFIALIAANGVKNNYYADDIVTGVVTLDNLFK